jgi:hypothetical protein
VQPETRYARSGDVSIAHQVVGEGPIDLVLVPGAISHLELGWEVPSFAALFRQLASFSRLIRFDKRGTGMSDAVAGAPTLEERMDDVRAVMDTVGRSELGGGSEVRAVAADQHGSTRTPRTALEVDLVGLPAGPTSTSGASVAGRRPCCSMSTTPPGSAARDMSEDECCSRWPVVTVTTNRVLDGRRRALKRLASATDDHREPHALVWGTRGPEFESRRPD